MPERAEGKIIVFEVAVPEIYMADLERYREYEADFDSESDWLLNLMGEPSVCRLRVETSGEKDSTVTETWGDIRGARVADALPSETVDELARLGYRLLRDESSCEWCDHDLNCASGGLPVEGSE